jgi:hypothetical protein
MKERRVKKQFPISALAGLLVATVCANGAEAERVKRTECKMVRRGAQIQLQAPGFTFVLDTADGLRTRTWQNRLTGREISLGLGPEVELDFDAAERRIWIIGWKEEGEQRTTHVFLPLEAKGKKLLLTLGGFGLFDYREIDVTLNGHAVGARHALKRWNEPGCFYLGPGAPVSPSQGQEDVLMYLHGHRF